MRSDQGAPAAARVDGIDVLRALAIFFVLLNHVNMRLLHAKVPYTAGLPEQLVSSLVWKGQYAVQMFFAVSGFLITTTALRRWGSLARINLRDFYVLRFGRYLIAMNTTEARTFEFDVPGDGWRDLVSKKNASTGKMKVGALSTVVLWRE